MPEDTLDIFPKPVTIKDPEVTSLEAAVIMRNKIKERLLQTKSIDLNDENNEDMITVPYGTDRKYETLFTASPNEILVKDFFDQDYYIHAYLETMKDISTIVGKNYPELQNIPGVNTYDYVYSFVVRTEKEGRKHPFLHAAELFHLSIERFARGGHKPKVIVGYWSDEPTLNTNYLQFTEAVGILKTQHPNQDESHFFPKRHFQPGLDSRQKKKDFLMCWFFSQNQQV